MEEITFTPGSVPVVVVARVYGKDASCPKSQHPRLYFARITSPFMEQLMNSRKEN